jgi:hypothetical protein
MDRLLTSRRILLPAVLHRVRFLDVIERARRHQAHDWRLRLPGPPGLLPCCLLRVSAASLFALRLLAARLLLRARPLDLLLASVLLLLCPR